MMEWPFRFSDFRPKLADTDDRGAIPNTPGALRLVERPRALPVRGNRFV
jgi:hypothetical protein